MKKTFLIFSVALALSLTPILVHATGIDPGNPVEVIIANSDNATNINEDIGGGIPIVTAIDPGSPPGPPPDPRPDNPPIEGPPEPPKNLRASGIILEWDPVIGLNEVGYKVYWGEISGSYDNNMDVGDVTTYIFEGHGLIEGVDYYGAVTSYNTGGDESGFSDEVRFGKVTTPIPPSIVLIGTGLLGLGILGRRRKKS